MEMRWFCLKAIVRDASATRSVLSWAKIKKLFVIKARGRACVSLTLLVKIVISVKKDTSILEATRDARAVTVIPSGHTIKLAMFILDSVIVDQALQDQDAIIVK